VSAQDLIELALRVAQRSNSDPESPNPSAEVISVAIDALEPKPQKPIETENPSVPPSVGLTRTSPAKEKKAADDLAAMILADLSKIDGCPKRGVNVTVYGSNPWNSWLSFGGAAGPVYNKAELQGFCDIITERLKRLYDVLP
jgi:hypothetical protein